MFCTITSLNGSWEVGYQYEKYDSTKSPFGETSYSRGDPGIQVPDSSNIIENAEQNTNFAFNANDKAEK